jgi:hypothetical protein
MRGLDNMREAVQIFLMVGYTVAWAIPAAFAVFLAACFGCEACVLGP